MKKLNQLWNTPMNNPTQIDMRRGQRIPTKLPKNDFDDIKTWFTLGKLRSDYGEIR